MSLEENWPIEPQAAPTRAPVPAPGGVRSPEEKPEGYVSKNFSYVWPGSTSQRLRSLMSGFSALRIG